MSKQIYEKVTASILKQLEAGVAPWVRPWSASPATPGQRGRMMPHNVASNRDYHGINVLILMGTAMMKGYETGAWATYKQIKERGGQVRKGERATEVVYFGKLEVEDKRESAEPGATRVVPLLRYFSVFNIAQADWEKDPCKRQLTDEQEEVEDDTFPDAAATIAATGATIKHGGDRAFYMPAGDLIMLPRKKSFVDLGAYYSTAFHELTHWTSAPSRCDRKLGTFFASPEYAFEELIAELGSAFLCAAHGVDGQLRHAEYLGHWIKVLKEDNTAIFKAAALAQKAADFVHPEPAAAEAEQEAA
jgi:antirestriction protein ArdC